MQDHIQEVLNKWESIDDEIWAKIIVLERNRRVAKAYARAPVLTVNGSDDGFDGFRIGLSGFENPMRDAKTEEVKRHIGQVSSAPPRRGILATSDGWAGRIPPTNWAVCDATMCTCLSDIYRRGDREAAAARMVFS